MRCNKRSVNSTRRGVRAFNDPYGSNELNMSLTDRYSAGVLDMTAYMLSKNLAQILRPLMGNTDLMVKDTEEFCEQTIKCQTRRR